MADFATAKKYGLEKARELCKPIYLICAKKLQDNGLDDNWGFVSVYPKHPQNLSKIYELFSDGKTIPIKE